MASGGKVLFHRRTRSGLAQPVVYGHQLKFVVDLHRLIGRLFDQYLRAHRNGEELIRRGESKTLEFKSTLRWNLKEDRQDDRAVTHAVLKTIAAFLNTEGDFFMRSVPATVKLPLYIDNTIGEGMNARVWRGWTRPEDADAYERLPREVVSPGLHGLSGYMGGYILRNDATDEP